MTPNQASWALGVLALVAAAACQDLPDVGRDECGNGVIELGEDCEAPSLDEDGNVVFACGAADGANACFYECVDDAACPPGYACGNDDRCRRAAGRFTAGAEVTLAVDDIAIGDVDGDGFADVVAGSGTSLQVNFGSAQGDLASSLDGQVATPETALVLGDLDGSGSADVLVATTPGVQTFLGSPERALDPFSYPLGEFTPGAGLLLGAALDLAPTASADQVLAAWGDRIGFVLAGPDGIETLPDPTGPLTGVAGGLAAPLPVARTAVSLVDATPAMVQDPTVEVALGYLGSREIFLYEVTAGPTIADSGVVLDAGEILNVGSGMFFGWFDGDHCIDLVVHAGAGLGRFVVFRGTPAATACTGALRAPVELHTPSENTRLFGVADLDGDGISDLVTSEGVLRVAGTGPWTVATMASAGVPYQGAAIVDLNGDLALDVVAFRESQPDAEVLINAGFAFNRFVIPTSDPVLRLAPGDFDGDLTQDIAIVELDSSGDDPVYTVSVSFGQFHGPPGARVIMDRFPMIAGLVPASVVGSAGALDAVDDLIVVVPLAAAMEATVLFGSGARAMTSPLALIDGGAQTPQSLVLGELDGSPGLDLFTVGGDRTAFRFAGDGAGGFTEAGQGPWPGDFTVADAVWASGDVDGDGLGEIAAAERNERGGVGPASVILFTPDPENLDADALLAEPDQFMGAHSIELADLDGDGDLDLLVGFDTGEVETGSLQVGWNDGSGIAGLAPLPGGDGCIAAVPITLDGDAQPELVALCRIGDLGGGGIKRFGLRRFDAVEPQTLVATTEPIAETPGGRSTRLLAGDVDGDGLDDLLLSTKGFETADVRVFIQSDAHDLDQE